MQTSLEQPSGFVLGHIGSVQEKLGASCFHISWRGERPLNARTELTERAARTLPDTSVLFDYGIGTSDQYEAIYATPWLFFDRALSDGTVVPARLQPACKALVFSHEHMDHLDAVVYAIQQGYIMPPIHTGAVAHKDLIQKLKEAGIAADKIKELKFEIFQEDTWVKIGAIEFLPLPIKHSTIEAFAFIIGAPNKSAIFYMGDGKRDPTTLVGKELDINAIKTACDARGYHLAGMMLESTNGPANLKEKKQKSEATVAKAISKIVDKHKDRDIVVTFMSRNDQRHATLEAIAGKKGRLVETHGHAHMMRTRILKSAFQATQRPDLDSRTRATHGQYNSSSEKRRTRYHSEYGLRAIIKATGSNAEPRSAMVKAATGVGKEKLNPKGKVFILSTTILEQNMDAVADMVAGLIDQKAHKIYMPGHSHVETNKQMRKLLQQKLENRGISLKKFNEFIEIDPNLHASGHADHHFLFEFQAAFSKAFILCIHGPYANVVDTIRMFRRNALKHAYKGKVLDMLPCGKFLKIPAPRIVGGKAHFSAPQMIGSLNVDYFEGVRIRGRGAASQMTYTHGLGSDGKPVFGAYHPAIPRSISDILDVPADKRITFGEVPAGARHLEISVGTPRKSEALIRVPDTWQVTTRFRDGRRAGRAKSEARPS